MKLLVPTPLLAMLAAAASLTFAKADPPIVRAAEETSPIRLAPMPNAVSAAQRDSVSAGFHARSAAVRGGDAQLDAMLRRAPGLIPLEAGFEDRDGMQVSTRVVAPDLRLPIGFQRVYAIPGDDEHFVRGDGAIFAVFPKGTYRGTASGGAPTLPPSTVFRFGNPTRDRWYGVTGAHQPDGMRVVRPEVAPIGADGEAVGMRSKPEGSPSGATTAAQRAAEFAAPRTEECSVDRSVPFAKLRFGVASRV